MGTPLYHRQPLNGPYLTRGHSGQECQSLVVHVHRDDPNAWRVMARSRDDVVGFFVGRTDPSVSVPAVAVARTVNGQDVLRVFPTEEMVYLGPAHDPHHYRVAVRAVTPAGAPDLARDPLVALVKRATDAVAARKLVTSQRGGA